MMAAKMKRLFYLLCPPVIYAPVKRYYHKLPWTKSKATGSIRGFNGWGMTTATAPPWLDANAEGGGLEHSFLATHSKVENLLRNGEMKLSQFGGENGESVLRQVRELLWRHYVVFWSVHYAFKNSASKEKNLVECGVCDGLTMFFALNSASCLSSPHFAYLYDSWEGMKKEFLLESEMGKVGKYAYLDIENTKKNLMAFRSRLVFNKGFVPESFSTADNPTSVVWLHIDINSAKPTIDSLEFFYDRLEPGGVILFDDYAWAGYEDMRIMIRKWHRQVGGVLLPFPTGQALFFKT